MKSRKVMIVSAAVVCIVLAGSSYADSFNTKVTEETEMADCLAPIASGNAADSGRPLLPVSHSTANYAELVAKKTGCIKGTDGPESHQESCMHDNESVICNMVTAGRTFYF